MPCMYTQKKHLTLKTYDIFWTTIVHWNRSVWRFIPTICLESSIHAKAHMNQSEKGYSSRLIWRPASPCRMSRRSGQCPLTHVPPARSDTKNKYGLGYAIYYSASEYKNSVNQRGKATCARAQPFFISREVLVVGIVLKFGARLWNSQLCIYAYLLRMRCIRHLHVLLSLLLFSFLGTHWTHHYEPSAKRGAKFFLI